MSDSSGTVRAVGVTTNDGPDALQVVHVPTRELGPTDVRVRVKAKLDELRQLAEDGVVIFRVADSYSPEDAGRAHERLEAGGTRGRPVIDLTR